MTEETTSEQLAEIEGQATEYTPPEGWRVVRFGEPLKGGDEYHAGLDRYIRRIKPEPQPQPQPQPLPATEPEPETTTEQLADTSGRDIVQGLVLQVADLIQREEPEIERQPEAKPQPQPEEQPQPQPVQVREGRWRTRRGDIRNVTPTPAGDGREHRFPWWDAQYLQTWGEDGRHHVRGESPMDLVKCLGPIELQLEPVPVPVPDSNEQIRLLKECNARQAELIADLKYERSGAMERAEVSARSSRKLTEQIEELRSEVSYVQRLLGESRQRVTQLEELVASLRTINEGAEKAVSGAGVVNDSLRLQLAAVKAELVTQAETSRRLQIELDAAHQVPADSAEIRQLRADLADVTRERDQHLDSYQRIFGDLETIRETTKAAAVEAIVEWLVPIRTCGSQALATAVVSNLPHIMRSLTGLEDEEIE